MGVKEIGDFAPLQRGFDLPAGQRKDGKYPVVYSNGIVNFHEKYQVNGPGVVTGRSGTLGKVHYVEGNFWPHNTSLWVTRFNGSHPKFVYFLFTYIGFERFASGSGVPTLNRNDAHSFRVFLPNSIDEQAAIASALSDVDALINELEKLIAKKQAIKTATMQQLLTGRTRLVAFSGKLKVDSGELNNPNHSQLSTFNSQLKKGYKQSELGEIPEDWMLVPLSTLVKDGRIPSGLYKDKKLYGEGTPIIKLGDVFGNDLFTPSVAQKVLVSDVEKKNYSVCIDDLIIALASVKLEGVGKVMLVDSLEETTVFDHNVALIRFTSGISSRFMSYVFKSNYIRSLVASRATQVGTTFLKTSTILEFSIALPECESEQTAIATILSDMDTEIQTLQQRLIKTRQIKQGMMIGQQLSGQKVKRLFYMFQNSLVTSSHWRNGDVSGYKRLRYIRR